MVFSLDCSASMTLACEMVILYGEGLWIAEVDRELMFRRYL